LAPANEAAKGTGRKVRFLILPKTFQRLGYFMQLHDVPKFIAEYISLLFGVYYEAIEWEAYDQFGARRYYDAYERGYFCPQKGTFSV